METQKDAMELATYLKGYYDDNNFLPSEQTIREETKWPGGKIRGSLRYLQKRKILEVEFKGTNFVIKTAPDRAKFKRSFKHEVNLGIYKYSWGAEER